MELVDTTGDCWIWLGLTDRDGYATRGDRKQLHRWFYRFLVGEIVPGMEIDHLCRVRNCLNPDHLEPVTQAENKRRQGAALTHCKSGHLFDEENTIVRSNGTRNCRACARIHARNYRQRKVA
jgi:hypothetical protein